MWATLPHLCTGIDIQLLVRGGMMDKYGVGEFLLWMLVVVFVGIWIAVKEK